jgi:hypothetical protein
MVLRPIATAIAVAVGLKLAACGSSIPQPPAAAQSAGALVEVDYPPPPARVEMVPKRPSDDAVWVNGEWLWQGRRWSWRAGMWVVSPKNAAYARRVLVRRGDGKLFFAPGTWRDADGGEVPAPPERVARPATGAVTNSEGETEPTGADVHPDAGADAQAPVDDFDAAPSR